MYFPGKYELKLLKEAYREDPIQLFIAIMVIVCICILVFDFMGR